MVASAMFLRTLLAAMLLSTPVWAQDCTVDGSLTQSDGLKLDIVYRCRSAGALTSRASSK